MSDLDTRIMDAFRNNGEEADGRIFSRREFADAVKEVMEGDGETLSFHELDEHEPPQILIDAMGRIYIDGNHVGWVKRDAGLVELKSLAGTLGCELPSLDAMLSIHEGGAVA